MLEDVVTSIRLCVVTIAICVVAYPLVVLEFAAVAAPQKRIGSLIADANGQIIGSRLIAQQFTRPKYFWPRPSACDYNAAAASGSNLSPANPELRQIAQERIGRLPPGEGATAPADLVTASGSGLDPHISYAAALFQAPRIARARGMSDHEVSNLINKHAKQVPLTSGPESRLVNVLELNLALDKLGN
jgi:potassium-transporting ATPase KdpC subunit